MAESGSEQPAAFFYYCSLNSDDRKQWLREMLVDGRVYFRRREELNDPNELRPSVVFEGTDKQIRTFVRGLIRTRGPVKLSPAQRLLEENKLIYRYRHMPLWVEQMLHELLDRIGVFCVSEVCTEHLLWAHYADGHRGIAIEFDPGVDLFVAAQRVVYAEQLPVINRLTDSRSEILDKSMLTKSVLWRYEREWRVIARWGDEVRIKQFLEQHVVSPAVAEFMRVQHGPGHYTIPSEAVRSVILGARVRASDEAFVRALIDERGTTPAIRRANIARSGMITID